MILAGGPLTSLTEPSGSQLSRLVFTLSCVQCHTAQLSDVSQIVKSPPRAWWRPKDLGGFVSLDEFGVEDILRLCRCTREVEWWIERCFSDLMDWYIEAWVIYCWRWTLFSNAWTSRLINVCETSVVEGIEQSPCALVSRPRRILKLSVWVNVDPRDVISLRFCPLFRMWNGILHWATFPGLICTGIGNLLLEMDCLLLCRDMRPGKA